jgi:2-polyprenyl-3-methyl-5-hydroxy-6-metoxy-1,4-benzoquinol methylase
LLLPFTNHRTVIPEIMDMPGIDPTEHRQALEGLQRINRASHTSERMLPPIIELAKRHNLNHLSLLDIACGGGDVPIGVALLARQSGINIELTFLDRSPTALQQASETAKKAGITSNIVQAEALTNLPRNSFDVVTNSLFLHHLPNAPSVVDWLRTMGELSRKLVVVSDLRRSRTGYAIAWVGCRVLSRSRIVHHDGPVSVRAAWTMKELSGFAARAGLQDVRIESCWPWRMRLVWHKP